MAINHHCKGALKRGIGVGTGVVLFCGSDVANALGYSNPSKALADHCRGVTKRYTPTTSGEQEMSFIPESGLYFLVPRSRMSESKSI